MAEYRYQLEPEIMRIHTLEKLKAMHLRLCENPWCAECHPERAEEYSMHSASHAAPEDHQPIDPPRAWWREVDAAMDAEILRARQAGKTPVFDPPMPAFPLYDETVAAGPPPRRAAPSPPPAPDGDG